MGDLFSISIYLTAGTLGIEGPYRPVVGIVHLNYGPLGLAEEAKLKRKERRFEKKVVKAPFMTSIWSYQGAFVAFGSALLTFIFCTTKAFGTTLDADVALPWQYGLQDPATPVAEGIIHFHHDLMFILIVVVVFVSWMLGRAVYHFSHDKNPKSDGVVHGTVLEIVWTIIPALILMVIAVPSFALLYSIDEVVDPSLTVKIVGHQWYWSYEYSDYAAENGEEGGGINFDSYMLPEDELTTGDLRLLEVDNRMVIPVDTHIRLVVTAADVLHSWTVPSFGVKMDACPGRLNQASLFVERPGVFYGQCSEICGVNHGFMPIAVEVVSMKDYLAWVYSKLYEDALWLRLWVSAFGLCIRSYL